MKRDFVHTAAGSLQSLLPIVSVYYASTSKLLELAELQKIPLFQFYTSAADRHGGKKKHTLPEEAAH